MSDIKDNKSKSTTIQNGKGMRPRMGYDIKKWDSNYDRIFGKKQNKNR